ncbi:MAG TPA: ABC transporter permease [Acidimicrobiales bacterium]|nr:ABC transporter permease [Acidimicrobiales bacterium]
MPELPSDEMRVAVAAEEGLIPAGMGLDTSPIDIEVEQPGTTEMTPDAEHAYAKKKLGVGFWVSTAWVALMILLAVFANLLPLQDPNAIGSDLPGLGPSIHHLLGTDELGRDLFARIVYGARVSLVVGFTSIALGMIVGGALGLLAGYHRGKIDALVVAMANILLAFPALVLALAIVTFWGASLLHVTLAIAILAVAPLSLLVRGSTIVFSQREFVTAARMLGAKSNRIIYREILANVLPTALSLGLISVAVAIVAEGALSFLGLSVHPPTASWGNMIAEGRIVMAQHPGIVLWPSIFLFLTVLSLNFAGDRLRSHFDVKEGAL